MSISISGEAAGTVRDALEFYVFRAEMDCGFSAALTPEREEAEKRLVQGKHALRSLPGDSSETPVSISISDAVVATVQSSLIAFIVQAETDRDSYARWTQERGVAKKRLEQGKYALQSLAWAISQSKGSR